MRPLGLLRNVLPATLAIACGESSVAKRVAEETATTTVSASSTAVSYPWDHVPTRLTYTQHAQHEAGPREDIPTEEQANFAPLVGTGRRFTIQQSEHSPDAKDAAPAVIERLIDSRGLLILSESISFAGEPTKVITYEPPRLVVPAATVDGATWSVTRYDHVTATVVLNLGSVYCADGFHTTTTHTAADGKVGTKRSHFCPGQGWRGEELVFVNRDQSRTWLWTTDLVADGVAWPDPPIDARFPNGSPDAALKR